MAIHAVAAVGCSRAAPQADVHPIPRQNVLLLTIDTLRADALGCYGGPAATPALDRLASEGVRFDFAHAHAVVTLTSHAGSSPDSTRSDTVCATTAAIGFRRALARPQRC